MRKRDQARTFDDLVRFLAIVCQAFISKDPRSKHMQAKILSNDFWDAVGGLDYVCVIVEQGFAEHHAVILDAGGSPLIDSTTSKTIQREFPKSIRVFFDAVRVRALNEETARNVLPFLIALAEGFPGPSGDNNAITAS